MTMVYEAGISEVGLEHVLEDGLALAEELPIEAERREIVLDGVLLIFDAATEGSELVQRNSLFIRADQKPAFETFEMIFKYLHSDYGDELPARIVETKDVFNSLRSNTHIGQDKLGRCAAFIKSFLEALRLKRALTEPNGPLVFVG